jgi:heat-inducible transcriptional repressor
MQGKPVSFLNNYLSKRNEESISRDEITALEILNRSILKLSRTKTGDEIFLFGAKNLLNRDDFLNSSHIGAVLELIDSKITLVHFLRQKADIEGVHVSVGEESRDGQLFRALSLVTAAFSWGSGRGMVGVLGPKRIPYARLIPVMQHAARVLSRDREILEEESQ